MNNKHYEYIDENGDYVDYWTLVNDINNAYAHIKKIEEDNKQLKKDIKNIIRILEKNCDDIESTEEEFDSLDRWQGLQVVELEQGSSSNGQ